MRVVNGRRGKGKPAGGSASAEARARGAEDGDAAAGARGPRASTPASEATNPQFGVGEGASHGGRRPRAHLRVAGRPRLPEAVLRAAEGACWGLRVAWARGTPAGHTCPNGIACRARVTSRCRARFRILRVQVNMTKYGATFSPWAERVSVRRESAAPPHYCYWGFMRR